MELENLEISPSPIITKKKEDKKKKSKIWDKSWKKKKLEKPTMTAVLFLRNNGRVERFEAETKKGFFEYRGKTYHEDRDCIWRMGKEGIPLMIVEEDSLIPMGTRRWYENRPNENNLDLMKRKFAELQDHLLRGIRHAELVRMGERDGKKLSGKAVIGLIIIGIIAFAVVMQYI